MPPGARCGHAPPTSWAPEDMARIGLVLGAGGVVGHAFHVAVLKALADARDWDPREAQLIVGTSAGSHVASYLRAGMSVQDLYARLVDEPLSAEGQALVGRAGPPVEVPAPRTRTLGMTAPRLVLRGALSPLRTRPSAMLAAAMPEGRVSLDPFAARIRWLHGDTWPRERIWLTAVGLDDGRRVVFGRPGAPGADVGSAVAASCAVPGWFMPVEIGGRRYIDGGVHSPSNLDLVAGEDLDLVIVSSPMSVARGHWRPSAAVNARGSLRLLLATEATRVRMHGTPVVAFQPVGGDLDAMGLNGMDARHRADTLRRVYRSTRQRLVRPRTRERLALLC